MFKIYVDRSLFCRSDSEELAIISPVVTLEANKAGTFEFTIPPTHPFYDAINTRTSVIDVFQNDTLIFEGFAVEQTVDFYKQKKVSCEGCFSYFNDSIQRQARYQNQTVRQLLTAYVTKHNEQVDDFKKFEVGAVTVTDSNNSIYCYTNNESTMSCLGADLVDDLGGYFRIRYEDYELVTDTSDNVITNTGDKIAVGARYLDYLSSSPRQNSQTIRIGKNLLEFSRNISSTDIATVCIPLGEKLDQQEVPGLDARLTIKSVNNGKDYIEATTVSTYGRVVRVVEFDKVTTASALKTKGEQWLSDAQFEKMVIEASAFDLSLSEDGFEDFQLLDSVRVVSEPHGLDRNFVITKLTYNLDAPESNTLTLGTETQAKISAQASKASGSSSEKGTVAYNAIQEAKANASSIMQAGGHGYVYFDYDEDSVIRSIMVMDTNDPNTATKRWVWNENGFGYEELDENGEWVYRNAMTMDGAIVADFITSGTMIAQNGNYEINTQTGKIKMKDAEITGGTIAIESSNENRDFIHLIYDKTGTGSGDQDATYINSFTPRQMESTFYFEHGHRPGDPEYFSKMTYSFSGINMYQWENDEEFLLNTFNQSELAFNIIDTYGTKMIRKGFHVFNRGGKNEASLEAGKLTLRDASGTTRVLLDSSGLKFYNASGTLTKTYSAT